MLAMADVYGRHPFDCSDEVMESVCLDALAIYSQRNPQPKDEDAKNKAFLDRFMKKK